MKRIRHPAVAGQFYPADKYQLESLIDKYLDEAEEVVIEGNLRALVEPHAGYIYSGSVAACGYRLLKNLDKKVNWKIFLLGPSHLAFFAGAALARVEFWETPLGQVRQSLIGENLKKRHPGLIKNIEAAHVDEHCLEVQLPFLQRALKNFEIIPLLLGETSPPQVAKVLTDYAEGESLFIASSDLSHYHSYAEAKRLDAKAKRDIPALKIKKVEETVEACGKVAILTLLHLAKEKGWQGKLLDYQNSGDTAGDKSRVVGYGCYAFYL